MTERRADEFGMRDMLILLNEKMDDVLRQLAGKAEASEMLKLRERMHAVEGVSTVTVSTLSAVTEKIKDNRDDINAATARVDMLERTQVSEERVAAALEKSQEKSRATIRWAIGLLGSLGIVNILFDLNKGGLF